MNELEQNVSELNLLVQQFKYEDALVKFYDENIVTQENEEPSIVGLVAYRDAGKKFTDAISRMAL